jgi:cytochrome b
MNTTSASPVEQPARPVLVWDWPVRVFHWLMVLSFAGAYLTAENERWRLLHLTLGYTMAGLVVFRLVWGWVGTHHARFANFVRGPSAVVRHVRELLSRQHAAPVGHNPAGAWAILGMLALTLAVAATGWATINELGGEWLADGHEVVANLMLTLVVVHIGGVVVSSWLQRENLVRAMITGYKAGRLVDGVQGSWRSVAVMLLLAVLAFWWLQWQAAPAGGFVDGPAALAATGHHGHGHGDDDD